MKVIVVCDANGECKAVLTDRELADQMADYFGACVSEHEVDVLSLNVAKEWVEGQAYMAETADTLPPPPMDTDIDVDVLVEASHP